MVCYHADVSAGAVFDRVGNVMDDYIASKIEQRQMHDDLIRDGWVEVCPSMYQRESSILAVRQPSPPLMIQWSSAEDYTNWDIKPAVS